MANKLALAQNAGVFGAAHMKQLSSEQPLINGFPLTRYYPDPVMLIFASLQQIFSILQLNMLTCCM